MDDYQAYEYLSNASIYSHNYSAYQAYAEEESDEVKGSNLYGAYQSLLDDCPDETEEILDHTSQALMKLSIKTASDRSVKNWNNEFQDIMAEDPSPEKYRELSRLAREFVFVASTYGRVIISEMTLPESNKSIKSVQVGGIAGGRKYIAQGILFKFNLDHMGLYGGDSNAQKAAGHEIKGLMSYSLLEIRGLHFPLMAVIDYMGFALTAMSLLPIGEEGSLKYGSNDCGTTMHYDSPECNELMILAASKLNLKGHIAGFCDTNTLIYGPGDIEVHQGIDNRFYMLDFARVFPPEAKFEHDAPMKGRHLYKLLRPELVRKYDVPLSSDAFSGWSAKDPERKKSALEVKECTTQLWTIIIPNFVDRFIQKFEESDVVNQYTCSRLIIEMHADGINVRYLGHIRFLLHRLGNLYPIINQIILTEMIARIVKDDVRLKWRETTKTKRYITEELCKEVLCQILNKVYPKSTPESNKWWTTLKQKLIQKFRYSVLEEELKSGHDFRDAFRVSTEYSEGFTSMMGLYHRVCELLGFVFSERGLEDIKTSLERSTLNSSFQIYSADIKQLDVMVKQTHVIELAEAQYLFYCGLASHTSEANRLISLAIDKLTSSPHVFLFPSTTFIEFGKQLSARICNTQAKEVGKHSLRHISEQCFEWASFLDKKDHVPLLEMAKMYYNCWQNGQERHDLKWEDITTKLIETLTKCPEDIEAILLLSKVYWQNSGQLFDLSRSFQLIESLATNHPDNPEVLIEHGNVLLAHIFYDLYDDIQNNPHAFMAVVTSIIQKYGRALEIDPVTVSCIPIASIIEPTKYFLCPRLDNDIPSPINKSAALFTLFFAASQIPILRQQLLKLCPNKIHDLSFENQTLLEDWLLTSIAKDLFETSPSLTSPSLNNLISINLAGCQKISDDSLKSIICIVSPQLHSINISRCSLISNSSFDLLLTCPQLKHVIAVQSESIDYEHFLEGLAKITQGKDCKGQLLSLSIGSTTKMSNCSLQTFLKTQLSLQFLDIHDSPNIQFSLNELSKLPVSLTNLDLSELNFCSDLDIRQMLQKISELQNLKIFSLKGANLLSDEKFFTQKAFGLQHPSLEVLISPKGITHYYSGASQIEFTFAAKIQAYRFTNGNFFWQNEAECSSCATLKEATFKLFRTLEGQHTEGRTLHINDARYVDIYTTSTETHVVLTPTTPHVEPIPIAQIKKVEDSRLSVQYFDSQTEVHVVHFASRSTDVSLFGSSCTAGPKETTVFNMRPSSHLGLTLGILISILIEHTTARYNK